MTAPTDAERAREIVGHLRVGWSALFNTDGVELMASTVADLIALNLREVRAEERERAARIAETFVDACDARTAREIADEIRAGEKH